ncbi:MAG: sugar ABC transporter ATP-binding protein [Lachnospiraceae bacterium]|nr:sugar ABC transporter ATP-binding protein [Lachnospiraceae bacterium]
MGNAVEFVKINKYFPGVHVLKDISFTVKEGEVHALLGENGAGKSTLLNILHGVYTEYEGSVLLHEKKVSFKNPNDAILNGKISKVHQETMVVEDLTVGQNVTLGYEPRKGTFIDFGRMNREVDAILEELNCNFRSADLVSSLTAGGKQMLAIAKALFHHSTIISLDEPTASLTMRETEALFQVIEKLRKDGVTVLYVSHRLEEIFQICDRATILRDGEYIETLDVKGTTREELIHSMVGRSVAAVASRLKPSPKTDEVVLKVEHLSNEHDFHDINFELHKGEILGFFGLVGAGRTEIMRTIMGVDQKTGGTVTLKGEEIKGSWNSTKALKKGIGLLPEDRKTQGFMNLSMNYDNIAISSLGKYMKGPFVDESKKIKNAERYFEEMDVHPRRVDYLTKNMSGGNQQKVILARWMSTDVDIIIFDEPTKGVDVAAKAEIYRLMEELVAEGKSLIVVSSELPEAMGISDRIIVMSEGRITAELESNVDFETDSILDFAIGGK